MPSIVSDLGQDLNLVVVVFNLLLSFALSFIIALVYKHTHKGLSYSQTFVLTLIVMGMVICAVVMVIGNNIARAFGAFGAFSLIRFRNAVKDSKDMGYIFLSVAVGASVGSGNYHVAVATTLIVLLVLIVLTKINFGSMRRFDYILNFSLDTKIAQEKVYQSVFDKYLKSSDVLNIKAADEWHMLQLSFSVQYIKESESQDFISALKKIQGISDINLISVKNDIEY